MCQIVKNIATLYCNIQTCQRKPPRVLRCGLSPSNSSLALLIKFLLMLYYVYSFRGLIWVHSLGGQTLLLASEALWICHCITTSFILKCSLKCNTAKNLSFHQGATFQRVKNRLFYYSKMYIWKFFLFLCFELHVMVPCLFFYLIHKSNFRIFLFLFWKIKMTMCSWKSWRNP